MTLSISVANARSERGDQYNFSVTGSFGRQRLSLMKFSETIRWSLSTGFDEDYAWTLLMLLRQRLRYMTKSICERLPFGGLCVHSLFTCFWKDMFPTIKLCSLIKLTRWCPFRFVLPWKEKPWAIWAFISPLKVMWRITRNYNSFWIALEGSFNNAFIKFFNRGEERKQIWAYGNCSATNWSILVISYARGGE